jgi:hypothetical protein
VVEVAVVIVVVVVLVVAVVVVPNKVVRILMLLNCRGAQFLQENFVPTSKNQTRTNRPNLNMVNTEIYFMNIFIRHTRNSQCNENHSCVLQHHRSLLNCKCTLRSEALYIYCSACRHIRGTARASSSLPERYGSTNMNCFI